MKFGVNTFIWGAAFGPSEFHLLPAIKRHGFDGIEFPILDPAAFEGAAIRRELGNLGLACTAVTAIPQGFSLGSSDAAVRAKAEAFMAAVIAAAHDAGATLLSGPFYTPVGHLTGVRRTADEWKYVVECWQRLAPAVHHARLEIGLEPLNRFETYFLNTVFCSTPFTPTSRRSSSARPSAAPRRI